MSYKIKESSVFERTFNRLHALVQTRVMLLRLQVVKLVSLVIGYFVWLWIILALVTLLMVFLGIVSGFWFSSLTGSYMAGFSITAGIYLTLILLLLKYGRSWFVNPVIRSSISKMMKDQKH